MASKSIKHIFSLLTSFFFLSSSPSSTSLTIVMEDWNILAADCIVISCCCQCLILQLLVYILFKLPSKLVCKTMQYMNKFRERKEAGRRVVRREMSCYFDEFMKRSRSRPSIEGESLGLDGSFCCMEEVENVMEKLSQKGEFGFGSFWRGDKEEFPICFGNYDLIKVVGSYKYR